MFYPTDEELLDRATAAYHNRFGPGADYPSSSSGVYDGDDEDARPRIVLENGNRALAIYRYDEDGDRLFYQRPGSRDHQADEAERSEWSLVVHPDKGYVELRPPARRTAST
jgi:hypothetical protein